jgi:superoxide dismutase, Cu-Zn family
MKVSHIVGAVAIACIATTETAASADKMLTAKATFLNTDGRQIGTATLKETSSGVLIRTELRGLPPGDHAFHVHQVGRCDAAGQFKSAGDHFALHDEKHGYEMTGGPHAGDMPNQHVGQDGILKADVFAPRITLGSGDGSILDQDGSALVIHAKADDYRSQPAGEAGDRVACAVIERE